MDTNEMGFRFNLETVHQGKMESKLLPIAIMTDVAKFEAAFPGHIMASENSSSIRVQSQGIARRMWWTNQAVTVEAIEAANIALFKGAKSTRTRTVTVTETVRVKVYELPDGTETEDRTEFLAAWMAAKVDADLE